MTQKLIIFWLVTFANVKKEGYTRNREARQFENITWKSTVSQVQANLVYIK